MKNLFLILLGCLVYVSAWSQTMQNDPTGSTNYLVPQGWKAEAKQEQGTYIWQSSKSLTDQTSPTISVLVMPNFPNSSVDVFITELKKSIEQFTISETKKVSANEVHFKASGIQQGQRVQGVFAYLADQNYIYLASFSALEKEYKNWGAESLLYKSLQRDNPFLTTSQQQGNTTNSSAGEFIQPSGNYWNMQDAAIQSQIINNSISLQQNMLVGKWLQVYAYSTGDNYQNTTTGAISYGEKGQGHILTFHANGTYSITYRYAITSGGCASKAEVVEHGKYSLNQQILTLHPSNYQANYLICGQASSENNTNPKQRQFRVAMDHAMQHIVIQGTPFEYSISTETDRLGTVYIQEGFNRSH